jgi:hypothetical protein
MTSEKVLEPEADAPTPLLTCEVCCEEIPPSEDFVSEAQAYIMYFCGLDCYAKWHEFVKTKDASGTPEKDR